MKYGFFIILLLCCSFSAWAENSVMVKGLFKNKVLLIVNGEKVMLRQGQSLKGIKLLESNSREALLDIGGKQHRVGLSKTVGGQYEEVGKKTVRISSKANGHHWVRGKINGRSVNFLVDTGASHIALGLDAAKRLGIDYEKGTPGYTNTANGVKEIRIVNLEKVSVGEITVNNVKASVSLDNSLNVSLLGNSFLSKMNMSIEDGVMILESK